MVGRPSTIGQDKGILGDKVDALMDASRNFMIGDLEFVFDESESIFTLEGPINPRNYHNTPEGCHTCQEKWKKATDLKGSHCHFCGMSNCKNCMKKTRKFCARKSRRTNSVSNLNGSKKETPPERGSICKLCDRKFFIKDMVKGTFKEITEHTGTLTQVVHNMEARKVEILEETEKHRLEVNKIKADITTVETEIRLIKDEVVESTTSCEHFRTEIEQSKVKEKLISD